MTTPYDPADDGAEMGFDGRLSYADYLGLSTILDTQRPLSGAHDEMLFIVQHQTSELWMRLAIHELDAARTALGEDRLRPAFKMLTRVARIFEQLTKAWDVLRTMTPSEYSEFRDLLGQSSGFQSHQYREIEFVVGNRNRAMLRPHAHLPEVNARLEAELARPSLYGVTLELLRRRGMPIPAAVFDGPLDQPHVENDAVTQCWQQVYEDPEQHWELYELAEKLVDFEDNFRQWRFSHVTTVERIIGHKRGTGGTSGVNYLRRMLDVILFPELWVVRTSL